MSIVGAVIIFFLMLLLPISKRVVSPAWQYYIWMIMILFFIVPLPQIGIGDYVPKLIRLDNNSFSNLAIHDVSMVDNRDSIFNSQLLKGIDSPRNSKLDFSKWIPMLSYIWFVGMIFSFLIQVFNYQIFKRKVFLSSSSLRDEDILTSYQNCIESIGIKIAPGVRQTSFSNVPFIIGIRKAVIYLPSTLQIKQIDYENIFKHELYHLKRKDLYLKWILAVVKSIHWFNPLVYKFIRLADEACEISCDAAVTQKMNLAEKKQYINTILELLSNSLSYQDRLSASFFSEKKQIRWRLMMIKKTGKKSKIVKVLSVSLIGSIAIVGFLLSSTLSDVSLFNKGAQNSAEASEQASPELVMDQYYDLLQNSLELREIKEFVDEHIQDASQEDADMMVKGYVGMIRGQLDYLYQEYLVVNANPAQYKELRENRGLKSAEAIKDPQLKTLVIKETYENGFHLIEQNTEFFPVKNDDLVKEYYQYLSNEQIQHIEDLLSR